MSYANTRLAYRRFIERYGPDEFFSMKEWVDQRLDTMGLQQILAFWRLGGYDAEFFIQSAKRIASLLPEASDEEMLDIQIGIHIMWSSNYVMEQRYDLALDAGLLMFEMDMYEDAKLFLETSVQADEDEAVPTVLYCLAICSYELGLEKGAIEYLRKALVLEPEHEEALALLNALSEGELR
jgi:tetratricopeptide (TPR) repeat protein